MAAASKSTARLREHYTTNVIPALTKEFNYKNIMAVPKLTKIALNIGLGEATGPSFWRRAQNPALQILNRERLRQIGR